MKKKKRLSIVIIVLLSINILIRIINCAFLTFGDYSHKNTYALDISSYVVWDTFEDMRAGTMDFGNKLFVSCSKGYKMDRDLVYYNKIWPSLGMLGIHNFGDKVDSIFGEADEYRYTIDADDGVVYICNTEYEEDCYFDIIEGKLVVADGYEDEFEIYREGYEQISNHILVMYDDYRETMREFCIKSIIVEFINLFISVVVIGILAKVIGRNESVIDSEEVARRERNMNLKYGMLEMLIYSFLVLFVLAIIIYGKDLFGFVFHIGLLLFAYLLASIVCMIVYFVKKRKNKLT